MAARFIWGCSSVGRAPALQAGGQEFESLHLHWSTEVGLPKGVSRNAVSFGKEMCLQNTSHRKMLGRVQARNEA